MWADSHCHVPYENVEAGVLDAARQAGVGRMISVGTDGPQSAAAMAVAAAEPDVWATIGLHPHDSSQGMHTLDELIAAYERDGSASRVVAIGECGLDYYYDHSDRPTQREAFAAQINLARGLGLALVVHTRDAWDDTFGILAAEGVPERTIVHCFTGGPDEAKRALDLGAWLSFSGIVTFKNAAPIREAAALCPPDRMLVETDAPFLAPVPHRGRPNQPAWVPVVGAAVAAVRGVPAGEIEELTWANTATVFGLPAA